MMKQQGWRDDSERVAYQGLISLYQLEKSPAVLSKLMIVGVLLVTHFSFNQVTKCLGYSADLNK